MIKKNPTYLFLATHTHISDTLDLLVCISQHCSQMLLNITLNIMMEPEASGPIEAHFR